ncbi:MAG: cryptochrome/photolyase family protein, partial [Actinomycetales bacterium]
MSTAHVRLVYPHQLFEDHLEAPAGTVFVLVEDDLYFRQYAFHSHKLVLHRASMRRFARRLRDASFTVEHVDSSADVSTHDQLVELLTRLAPEQVTVFDVVDDWLSRDVSAALLSAGIELSPDDVLE